MNGTSQYCFIVINGSGTQRNRQVGRRECHDTVVIADGDKKFNKNAILLMRKQGIPVYNHYKCLKIEIIIMRHKKDSQSSH